MAKSMAKSKKVPTTHACDATVYPKDKWGSFHGYPCSKQAKVERDGKWYCGIHDPVMITEKNNARLAKWKIERDEEIVAREKAKVAVAEMERRAVCYPDLFAACEAVAGATNDLELSEAVAQAEAAITKAKGGK